MQAGEAFFLSIAMLVGAIWSTIAYFSGANIHGSIPIITSFLSFCLMAQTETFWIVLSLIRNIPVFISRMFRWKKRDDSV